MNNTISQLAMIMQMYPNDERRRHDLAVKVALELPILVRELPSDALEIVREWLAANGCVTDTGPIPRRPVSYWDLVRTWAQGDRNPTELVRVIIWSMMGFK